MKDAIGWAFDEVRVTKFHAVKDHMTGPDGRFVDADAPSDEWRALFRSAPKTKVFSKIGTESGTINVMLVVQPKFE